MELTDRVSVWGVTGYGSGGLMLTPGEGTALESGLSMAMAAGGARGDLIGGGAAGFALAFKTDALWVGTGIDGVNGPAGRLAATEAAVTRVRTGLEGSRAYTLGNVLLLKPMVEVGLRHDGGDAETGAGMDLGGGLTVSAPATGLSVDVRVRMLLVHQAEGFRERGMSVSVSYKPEAVDAAGVFGQGGAVVGRSGQQRGAGAVGPGDDGRAGERRCRLGQPPGRRGRLRAAGGEPHGPYAAGGPDDLRVRADLPAGVQPRRAEPGESGVRVGGRRAAPGEFDAGEFDAGRRGQWRARPGLAGLVATYRRG